MEAMPLHYSRIYDATENVP